jgi:hypothetical protein
MAESISGKLTNIELPDSTGTDAHSARYGKTILPLLSSFGIMAESFAASTSRSCANTRTTSGAPELR